MPSLAVQALPTVADQMIQRDGRGEFSQERQQVHAGSCDAAFQSSQSLHVPATEHTTSGLHEADGEFANECTPVRGCLMALAVT